MSRPGLGAFDWGRLAAALLVVAIHTSPLGGVSELGDFLLCRVLARLAVPFFFMLSGFFLLPEPLFGRTPAGERLGRCARRILLLYGAAILVYLPVNIYAGHWAGLGLWGVLRRLLFEGTLYHLWYLPALLLGLGVALLLGRRLSYGRALAAAAGLYALGLLGDGYWGLAAAWPPLRGLYGAIFAVMGSTRSGLFMAPVFLLLGAGAARDWQSGRLAGRGRCALGLGLSLGLLLAEGLLLHRLGWQRHDSMYIALPLCLYWLTRLLAGWPAAERPGLRSLAAAVYLLHPLVIIGLRGLWPGLLAHKPVYYLGVCGVSLMAAWLAVRLAAAGKAGFKIRLKNMTDFK